MQKNVGQDICQHVANIHQRITNNYVYTCIYIYIHIDAYIYTYMYMYAHMYMFTEHISAKQIIEI